MATEGDKKKIVKDSSEPDKPDGFVGQSKGDRMDYDKFLNRLKVKSQIDYAKLGASKDSYKQIVEFKTDRERMVEQYLPHAYKLANADVGTPAYFEYKYYQGLAGSDNPYDIANEMADYALRIKEMKTAERLVLGEKGKSNVIKDAAREAVLGGNVPRE